MLHSYPTRREGEEWSRRALEYMRAEERRGRSDVTYEQALRFVLDEDKSKARTYALSDTPSAEGYRFVGNVIAAAKDTSGRVDVNLALAQLKNIDANLIYDAAQLKLDAFAHEWIKTQGLPGPMSDHLSSAYQSMLSQYPGTALAYGSRGRSFDERTLKEMYPQFFK